MAPGVVAKSMKMRLLSLVAHSSVWPPNCHWEIWLEAIRGIAVCGRMGDFAGKGIGGI